MPFIPAYLHIHVRKQARDACGKGLRHVDPLVHCVRVIHGRRALVQHVART